MEIIKRAVVAVPILVFLFSTSVKAELADSGTGARAVAMGQAQTAVANDASAVNYNPAALVYAREYWEVTGRHLFFQIGKSGYQPYLRLNGIDQEYPYASYTTLGAVIPLGKRITIGVDFQYCDDWVLYTLLANGPRFNRYTPTQQVGGKYGFALKITDKFSVGYSSLTNMHFNFSTISLDLNAVLAGLGLPLGELIVNMNPYMEVDVLPTSSYQVGALYRPFKWLHLGVNYNYKNPSYTIIPVYLPAGLLPETHLTITTNSERPTMLTFGIGVFPNDKITLAFDLSYDMWSRTKNYWKFEADSSLFSFDNSIVEPDDVWVPRVGVEYRDKMKGKLSRASYAIRGGYLFYKSPYPEATGANNDIDNDAHNISFGLSLGYSPKKHFSYIGVEYFWEYMGMVERTHADISRSPAVIVSDGYVIYNGFTLSVKL